MSVTIKAANGDIFWFDAVTDYKLNLSSQVSSHPIESGANVADHVVRQNPKIRLSGLFSDYDPHIDRPSFSLLVNQTDEVKSTRIVNNYKQEEVTVRSKGVGSQTLTGFDYDIVQNSVPVVSSEFIKKRLNEIQRGGEACTVIEFDGAVIKANGFFQNAIIVSIDYVESPDSGDALYVDMELEIVTFVDLKKVNLPKILTDRSRATNRKPSVNSTQKADASSPAEVRTKPNTKSSELFSLLNK
jgi:hypothetical protein